VLNTYGGFDVSVASDLPLFIDPFLLFHSDKPEYQALHEGIQPAELILNRQLGVRDSSAGDSGGGLSSRHALHHLAREERGTLRWLLDSGHEIGMATSD